MPPQLAVRLKGAAGSPTGAGGPRSASTSLSEGSRPSPVSPAPPEEVFRSEPLLSLQLKKPCYKHMPLASSKSPSPRSSCWFNLNVMLVVTHPLTHLFAKALGINLEHESGGTPMSPETLGSYRASPGAGPIPRSYVRALTLVPSFAC